MATLQEVMGKIENIVCGQLSNISDAVDNLNSVSDTIQKSELAKIELVNQRKYNAMMVNAIVSVIKNYIDEKINPYLDDLRDYAEGGV